MIRASLIAVLLGGLTMPALAQTPLRSAPPTPAPITFAEEGQTETYDVAPPRPAGSPSAQITDADAPAEPTETVIPEPLPDETIPAEMVAPVNTAPPFDWSRFRLGGQYRILPNASNFGFHSPVIRDSTPSQFLFLQRMRLWLTYNPTENVEGYIQMQVGQVPWGAGYDFNKSFTAGGTPVTGDHVGILLRRSWLAVKNDAYGVIRAGILDWHDSFGDTMASADYDFNMGGIEWKKEFTDHNKLVVKSAMLLLNDKAFNQASVNPGPNSAYLFAWDVDQPIGEKHSVGFSAYYLNDRGGYSYSNVGPYSSSWDTWFGARAKLGFDRVPISGYILANNGQRDNLGPVNFTHSGWATQLQVGAIEIGPGKLSMQGLYASGGNGNTTGHSGEFRTLAQSYRDNYGAQGYWSYLHLTSPNGPGDISDLGVGLQNRGLGLATTQIKYEYPLAQKLIGITAGGWLRSATVNPHSGSTNMGTELMQQFTYDFGGNMKLDIGTAVLFTGNFYRDGLAGPPPSDLYEAFSRLQLEF